MSYKEEMKLNQTQESQKSLRSQKPSHSKTLEKQEVTTNSCPLLSREPTEQNTSPQGHTVSRSLCWGGDGGSRQLVSQIAEKAVRVPTGARAQLLPSPARAQRGGRGDDAAVGRDLAASFLLRDLPTEPGGGPCWDAGARGAGLCRGGEQAGPGACLAQPLPSPRRVCSWGVTQCPGQQAPRPLWPAPSCVGGSGHPGQCVCVAGSHTRAQTQREGVCHAHSSARATNARPRSLPREQPPRYRSRGLVL